MPGLALIVGLGAVGVTNEVNKQASIETVELVKCSGVTVVGRPAAPTHMMSPGQIQLSCGGSGVPGAVGGTRIALPSAGATKGGQWAANRPVWGQTGSGVRVNASKSWAAIGTAAVAASVPWPDPMSKRARNDKSQYSVYQIVALYRTVAGERVFKYGITKVGPSRPRKSAYGHCPPGMPRCL